MYNNIAYCNQKTRAPYEDEEYMTKVYGKASYQGKRTTMKDPYLHFKNDPKQKPDRPPGVTDSKGIKAEWLIFYTPLYSWALSGSFYKNQTGGDSCLTKTHQLYFYFLFRISYRPHNQSWFFIWELHFRDKIYIDCT